MAEYTNSNTQTVPAGRNVIFTETRVPCNKGYVVHREGSGVFTLRGITNQCRARYNVSFGGNIAVPTGGTAGPISIAISVDGEALNSATATVTPAAAGDYFNVYISASVDVPKGCCTTVSIENISGDGVDFANPNLQIDRKA